MLQSKMSPEEKGAKWFYIIPKHTVPYPITLQAQNLSPVIVNWFAVYGFYYDARILIFW